MSNDQGRALDWNDTVENDGNDFTLLPPGVYPFQVVKFERAHFAGSAKQPACNQAKLTLEVGDAEQSTTVQCNLFLHSKNEWILCQFFRSIGARKHGERVVMDWSKVPGSTGKCQVVTRKWAKKEEKTLPAAEWTGENNDIKKFLDPEGAAPAPAAAGAVQAIPGEQPF